MQTNPFRIAAFVVFVALTFAQFPVGASGVTITLNDGSGTADAGSGGNTEIQTTWTSTGIYSTGSTITLTLSPAATSTILNCDSFDCQFNGSAVGCDVTFATTTMTSSTASGVFAQSVVTSTSGTLCFEYPISATSVGNYSIAVLVSNGSTNDFGASLYYVLGANQVTVTATVPATLSFAIRNTDDTATTTTCPLGTLSQTAVNLCSYRLRIATNASNGFNSTIKANLDLNNGTGNATITPILNDTTFASGTEAYGIAFLTGAYSGVRSSTSGQYVAPVVESCGSGYTTTTFCTDSSPVPTTTGGVQFIYATSAVNPGIAPSTSSTTLVVHGAAINAGTPSGQYSQTVTYLVTGSF